MNYCVHMKARFIGKLPPPTSAIYLRLTPTPAVIDISARPPRHLARVYNIAKEYGVKLPTIKLSGPQAIERFETELKLAQLLTDS